MYVVAHYASFRSPYPYRTKSLSSGVFPCRYEERRGAPSEPLSARQHPEYAVPIHSTHQKREKREQENQSRNGSLPQTAASSNHLLASSSVPLANRADSEHSPSSATMRCIAQQCPSAGYPEWRRCAEKEEGSAEEAAERTRLDPSSSTRPNGTPATTRR